MWPRTHRIHEELIRQPPPGMTVALVVAAVLVAALAVVTALATAPYASAASRDHGASFAVRCAFSHRNSDDPIVHPGEEGAAHSHDFLGNASTKFDSTYESMITAPTTCTRPEDTAGYWIPTVKWNGEDLEAFRAVFYYRAGGKDHTQVKPFDKNLKVITGSIRWYCGRKDGTEGSKAPPTQCSSGVLGVRIVFPDCVAVDPSGIRQQLDSADHKSHMARSVLQSDGGTRQCLATHPLPVPTLTVNANFPIPTTPGTVTLSSGDVSTMHADFWNTWDQDAPLNEPELRGGLNALVKRCINEVPPSGPHPEVCRAPTATV
jgi:hypothetical protein